MKSFTLGLLFISVIISCRTIEKTVVFDNKRTPINPIAHKGYNYYQLFLDHRYNEAYQDELSEYQKEVERLTTEYNEAMAKYNSYNVVERKLRQIKHPALVLPDEPKKPHQIDDKTFLENIIIEGMSKGERNALQIHIKLNGYEWKNPRKNVHTKKMKDEGEEEKVDTTYSFTASVRHPVETHISTPEGESVELAVDRTFSWSNFTGEKAKDTSKAYSNLLNSIEAGERQIPNNMSKHVNQFLNSELGTVDVRYKVTLYSFKSNNRKDYSDLDQALFHAEEGLRALNTDRNKGIESLNKAIVMWEQAANEYRQNLGKRIDEKEMKALLLNLLTAATFTQNWEAGNDYILEMQSLKLKRSERANFNRIRTTYKDLKERYKVAG